MYRSCVPFITYIPRYLIFFEAVVNSSVLIFQFTFILLLVFRHRVLYVDFINDNLAKLTYYCRYLFCRFCNIFYIDNVICK